MSRERREKGREKSLNTINYIAEPSFILYNILAIN